MRKSLLAALAAMLVLPAAAGAGGWATAGVEPLPPSDADKTWNVTVTVLQHGRTPTDDAKPSIALHNLDDGKKFTVHPKPAGNGRYTAAIVFPSGGTWEYTVNNGFGASGYGESAVQTFKPVEIAGPTSDDGSGLSLPTVGGAVILAAALLGLTVFLVRRRLSAPDAVQPA